MKDRFAVIPGSGLHGAHKAAVVAGNRLKADHAGYAQDGFRCGVEQDTGLLNPGIIDKIQRRGTHDVVEQAAEVSGTQMTQIRQEIHGKLLHIVVFHIIQGGGEHNGRGGAESAHGFVLGGGCSLCGVLDAVQRYVEGQEQAPGADLVAGILQCQLFQSIIGHLIQEGMFLFGKNVFIIRKAVGEKVIVLPVCRQQVAEKLSGIQINIGPVAGKAGRRIGSVGDIAGNDRDVPFFKGSGLPVEFQAAAVGMADADFQAVVKVEVAAGPVGDFPVVAGQGDNGKMGRKIVVSVFCYNVLSLCHIFFPLDLQMCSCIFIYSS